MATLANLIALGVRPKGAVLIQLATSSNSFSATLSAGAQVAAIIGKTPGSTLSISPADGVLVLDSGQANLLRGLSAISGDFVTYTVTETLAGALNSPKTTSLTLAVIAAPTKFSPGSGWAGTPDASQAPSQPTRTGGYVPGNLLTADMRAVTSDEWFVVDAKQGSCSGVTVSCEGGTPLTVTVPGFHSILTPNGTATVYGYAFQFDSAAARAINPAGRLAFYFTKHSSNPAIADHVIGPYYFDPRLPTTDIDASTPTTIGANYEFDKKIIIDQTAADAADVAGVSYNDPVKALAWLTTAAGRAFSRAVLYCVSSGNIPFWASVGTSGGAGLGYAPAGNNNNLARTSWTVLKAKVGVTVIVGDGSRRRVSAMGFDALEFRGANVRVDLNAIDPGGSPFRLSAASNAMLRFNGCEYFAGDNSAHIFDSTHGVYLGGGSGAGTTYDGQVFQSQPITSALIPVPRFNLYFEFVNAHDLPQYGLSFAKMVLCSTLDTVSSSAMENNWAVVHGNTIKNCDAQATAADCRVFKPCMKLKAPTGWYAAITGGNSSTSRHFQIYDNTSTIQFDSGVLNTTPPVASSTTGTTTKVADVVAAINATLGASGVTAVEIVQNRMASMMTFTQTSLPETHISLNPTTDTVLNTFIDAHADGVVYHTTDIFQNVTITMNRFLRHAASHISFSYDGKTAGVQMKAWDINIEWNEFFDISAVVYGLSYSGSYNQALCSNFTFENFSEYGGATSWSRNASDSADGYPYFFNGDATCVWRSWACNSLAYSTGLGTGGVNPPACPVDNDITVDHIASIAVLPPNCASDPQSTHLGVTIDQMFNGPVAAPASTATDFDFTPSGTHLLAADRTWRGSRNNLGQWNGAVYA